MKSRFFERGTSENAKELAAILRETQRANAEAEAKAPFDVKLFNVFMVFTKAIFLVPALLLAALSKADPIISLPFGLWLVYGLSVGLKWYFEMYDKAERYDELSDEAKSYDHRRLMERMREGTE